MLFTEAQDQFKVLQDQALKGQPLVLEPGYDEAYKEWSAENEAILPKLSSEERTVSFSDHVEDKVQKEEAKIVEETEKNPEKKKQLLNQVQRGQLLLASTDGGKNFDKVLSVKEAQKMDPLSLHFLTPTLRSTTNNVEEVSEEQSMLHAVRKLREQHFLVERAYVENHVVHIDATHPRRGTYEVQVALDKDPTLPLEYAFINLKGVQRVQETQLPNEYGEAAPDPTFEKSDFKKISSKIAAEQEESQNKTGQIEKQAVMASLFSHIALGAQKRYVLNALERATQSAEQTKLQMKSPVLHQNVMAAKTSMMARKARQEKQTNGEKERQAQREEKFKTASKKAYEEQMKNEKEKTQKQKELQSKFRKSVAVGTGAAAGLFAGASSFTFWLTHLAHS